MSLTEKGPDLNEDGGAMCPRVPHGTELDLLVVQQAGHKGFMDGSVKRSYTISAEYFIEDVEDYA